MYLLLSDTYETMKKEDDPLLYPGLMSDEEMAQLPGTIVQTAEWDFKRLDAYHIIPRLQKGGVYLDHAQYCQTFHDIATDDLSNWMEDLAHEDIIKAWQTYSIKGAPREWKWP